MKKIISIVSILLCTILLTACNKYYKLTINNIAEIRHNIFAGSSDYFDITFMSGKREKDYVLNGYNTDLIDFGILTITLKNQDISILEHIALTIDTLRYEDTLEKNPFDGTYVSDIGVLVDNNLSTITVKVFYNDLAEEIKLNNISNNWEVNCFDALKLSCNALSNELESLISSEFLGEVYVKIIEDTIVNNGSHYWYVNFLGRNGHNFSVIINPVTSEILAKK